MPEPQRASVTRFKYIFWFTILFLIGMGVYSNITHTSTGGTLYWRSGGSSNVSYGGNEMFVIAGVLLLGALFLKVISILQK